MPYNKSVHIGENVWVGAGTVIVPGVTIGKNSVIGAGSVVVKDIPENVAAVGNLPEELDGTRLYGEALEVDDALYGSLFMSTKICTKTVLDIADIWENLYNKCRRKKKGV